MRIVLFNGPPRSGKDTSAKFLELEYGAKIYGFANAVKEMAHLAYTGQPLPHDHFEEHKETPLDIFLGKTPRQVYIAFSEQLMKPLHGKDVFAKIFWDRVSQFVGEGQNIELLAVPDAGFADEVNTLTTTPGVESVTLVRLHREGCDFEGDSRSYIEIDHPGHSLDIYASDPEGLRSSITTAVATGNLPIGDLKLSGQWLSTPKA